MSWRPAPEAEKQIEAVRRALAETIDASGLSRREIDRRVGWTENYLSQILRDAADLKMVHVAEVLRVLRIEPSEFFARAFRHAEEGPSDDAILQSLTAMMARYEERLKALERQVTTPEERLAERPNRD